MFGFGSTELSVLFCIIFFTIVPIIVPIWKIFSKAGFPGWLSLSMFIPILNIIVLFYFAFSEWPALKK